MESALELQSVLYVELVEYYMCYTALRYLRVLNLRG